MKRHQFILLEIVVSVFLSVVGICECVFAESTWIITQLTNNETNDEHPSISGTNVVWEGYDGYDYEIYSNFAGQLTINDTDDQWPSISGTNVAWMGWDGQDYEIYMAEYVIILDVTVDILGDTITPKTRWIKCQVWPPSGYTYADIDIETIVLEWQIPVDNYSFNEKKQKLVVTFPASWLNLVPSPDPIELTVSGELIDGTEFEGSDFVTVVEKGGKKK